MDILLQQIINGLVLGSMYALIALGYTMVYGIIQLINFAHGEVLMVGALVAWTVIGLLQEAVPGMPTWLILLAATIAGCAVAALLGVKPDAVISATFAIGAVLAAIAGVMYASNYGTAQHFMGFLPGLKAFTAAVFGGIGNLAGAVVGGVLLGLIEAIGSGYLGTLTGGLLGSHYADIFAFIVLIIVLTLRPSGLLGERVADRA